ncbi:UNVERIFIED_CONTAM: hypothetical protein HDU68_003046 [Siphonaria sp. JEL0065]|nr:hypothetical protein HDU68_003046 [Siphonaria sp. JEL0065]
MTPNPGDLSTFFLKPACPEVSQKLATVSTLQCQLCIYNENPAATLLNTVTKKSISTITEVFFPKYVDSKPKWKNWKVTSTRFPAKVDAGDPDAIRTKKSLEPDYLGADKLTLVRICKEDVGGLTMDDLERSQDFFKFEAYPNSPERTKDGVSKFRAAPGACLMREGLTFKVMNSMDQVSVFTASLPDELYHVLVLVPNKTVPRNGLVASDGRGPYIFKSLDQTGSYEGIQYSSPSILHRESLTSHIVDKLWAQSSVLLFNSTPMTGKSSMATLVAHRLDEQLHSTENAIILHFSIAQFLHANNHWQFQESFDLLFGKDLTWASVLRAAIAGVKIFLIIDEAHLSFKI